MFPHFTKRQRIGALILFLIIVLLQLVLFFTPHSEFLSLQPDEISLNHLNKEFVALKQKTQKKGNLKLFPFNPNFITPHKGYVMGMSVSEIQRLKDYRSDNKWINSIAEFQAVTGVSDSLLALISPYFKFPDWVQAQNKAKLDRQPIEKLDLNSATNEQLQDVYGIGPKLAERIINYRNRFEGGFASMFELKSIYGLTNEVISNINKTFDIKQPRNIKKINLNIATQEDLVQVPYIDYELAYSIIEMRVLKEGFKTVDELTKLKDFPTNKLDIIKLYLHIK